VFKINAATIRDVAGVAGAVLIVRGVALWSEAAAYIVGGLMLVAVAFLLARSEPAKAE
jgi:hypothetical protein